MSVDPGKVAEWILELGRARAVVAAAREWVEVHRHDWMGCGTRPCQLCAALAAYDGAVGSGSSQETGQTGPKSGSGASTGGSRADSDGEGVESAQGEFPPIDSAPCYGHHAPGRDGTCVRCDQTIRL